MKRIRFAGGNYRRCVYGRVRSSGKEWRRARERNWTDGSGYIRRREIIYYNAQTKHSIKCADRCSQRSSLCRGGGSKNAALLPLW